MKAKWKETEFWVLVLTLVATVCGYLADRVDGNTAVVVAAIQAAAYTAYRQLSKRSPTDEIVRNAVFTAILQAGSYRKAGGNGHGPDDSGERVPNAPSPGPRPPAARGVG